MELKYFRKQTGCSIDILFVDWNRRGKWVKEIKKLIKKSIVSTRKRNYSKNRIKWIGIISFFLFVCFSLQFWRWFLGISCGYRIVLFTCKKNHFFCLNCTWSTYKNRPEYNFFSSVHRLLCICRIHISNTEAFKFTK